VLWWQSMKYHSGEEVEADINLVFDNAIKYNPPGHPIHMQVRVFCLLPRVRGAASSDARAQGAHGEGSTAVHASATL
jgi:hypothetical protein